MLVACGFQYQSIQFNSDYAMIMQLYRRINKLMIALFIRHHHSVIEMMEKVLEKCMGETWEGLMPMVMVIMVVMTCTWVRPWGLQLSKGI